MTASSLFLALPCSRCGVEAGSVCVRLDGKPSSRPHAGRTPPAPCGTHGGYVRHIKNKTQPCDECREATRRYMGEYRRKNPERRQRDIDLLRARKEATRLLVEAHREEFRSLLAELVST